MSNEEIREKFNDLIENLNDEGLRKISILVGVMEHCVKYDDKRISPERLEEIRKETELKEAQDKEERNKKLEDEALERSRQKVKRMKEKKANLPSNYKRLFKRLEIVSADAKNYDISGDEMYMFNDVFEGSLLNGMHSVFLYGFMRGQICEKRKIKQLDVLIETKEEKSIA